MKGDGGRPDPVFSPKTCRIELMPLLPKIESLCKAAAMVDPNDLPALTSVHDQLIGLGPELAAPDYEAVLRCVEHTKSLIEQIVLRETQDAAATFDQVLKGIEYAQAAINAGQRGEPVSSAGPSPFASESGAGKIKIDETVLAAWLAESGHTLDSIEESVIAIGGEGDVTAPMGELRRRLHTVKGECGAIPLPEAQRVCHQAESYIDACEKSGRAFPADAMLSLVDWFREYVTGLRKSSTFAAPSAEALIASMDVVAMSPASASPDPAPANEGVADSRAENPQPDWGATSGAEDPTPVSFPADAEVGDCLAEFLAESREHITNSEQALLSLEKDPREPELVNTVFRAFHTIKGVAGFMNLAPIVKLAHHGECLLDNARSGKLVLNSASLDAILKGCDLLGQLLSMLEGGKAPTKGRFAAVIEQLDRATSGGGAPVKAAAPAPTPAAVGAPVLETPKALAPAPIASVSADKPTARPAAKDEESEAPAATAAGAAGAPRTAAKPAEQTVKVSTGRMDMLVDMVGELVIAQQMVVQDPRVRTINEQRVQRNLAMVGKIIRDLQAVSMALRMVPIKATFQRMTRIVRDVSAKAGKRIALHTEGEDVELDRNVVEVIADPLVHMIRNACDHGVEGPEARKAAGKPEMGNISLRAFHSGGSIVIEIEDDGKGLVREKILSKAVEKGIYTPDRPLDEIPDSEVYNLVFLPGFSTAEKVTDISGRGVGMDVVKRNIESLRGKVEIRSTPGKGTVFSMRLPLTMAIIDGMVVRVGTQRYVIPTLSVERSFRPGGKDLHTVVGKGEMAMVRGGLLPIHRLDGVLEHEGADGSAAVDLLVVVESQNARACLAVDEIIGQQQVVIKSLGLATGPICGVSGGAILGDGRVALILDVGGILTKATKATGRASDASGGI
jgi:two-component system chemotaxis sensor kinase CheA